MDHASAKSSEIAEYMGLKPSRVRDYLAGLIAEEIVVAEGGNRNRTYRLKSLDPVEQIEAKKNGSWISK